MQQERREIGARQGWLVSLELGTQEDQGLDVILRWAVFDPALLTRGGGASYVTARRVLASRQGGGGGGESDATLVLDIFNHHASASVSVLVLDRLPWFARILVHTLRVKMSDQNGKSSTLSLNQVQDGVVSLARLREGMTMLEYRLDLPGNSSARVEVDMRRAFLHLDDFPPGNPKS